MRSSYLHVCCALFGAAFLLCLVACDFLPDKRKPKPESEDDLGDDDESAVYPDVAELPSSIDTTCRDH